MKKMKRLPARAKKELLIEQTGLIWAALYNGANTRLEITNQTGIQPWTISAIFKENKELYNAYVVRRKSLVDTAADNLVVILGNPEHPQHFAATKYVLQNFKSDLDDILDAQDVEEMKIEIPQGEGEEAIKIVFGKKKD